MQERRHAAIMFTDIVGYTQLMGQDEEKALSLLEKNREIHHLALEKYNGTLDDVFDIQEKVSRSIVNALKFNLSPEEEIKLVKHPIPQTDANDFYLKARYEIMRFTDESLSRALVSLQSALDITGANARLYAEIGFAHFQFVNRG